jgi:hypothetical protein
MIIANLLGVFLQKNETLEHFKYFHAKLLKQFNKKIQVVRLDKGWNIVLGYLLFFARSKA